MEKPLLIYKNENLIYGICLIVSILTAVYLLVSIIGVLILVVFGLISLFSHAISMTHIQVNGVRIKENQFPKLYKKAVDLCEKMEITKVPEVYVVESGGMLNAFATKVLGLFGKNIVVLYSDFVDISFDSNGHEIDFVIAHELSHIKRNHITKSLLIFPAMWIPFLGVSFTRMAEYTCDRMAAYYTNRPHDAINGLLILAAGKQLYKNVNIQAFMEQYNDKRGILVTLMEMLSTHPSLPKRIHEIESFMFGKSSVPLIKRKKQTVAVLLVTFILVPFLFAGIIYAGILAFDKLNISDWLLAEPEYTALMEAAQDGDVEKTKSLLSAGDNPNELNEYGESPLIIAIMNEDKEMIQLLLENGADPNLQDEYGWTPFMSAVMTENMEIGKILLEAGADPLLVDESDMSALDYAKDLETNDYVQLIKGYIK
jgi:Zn-dependent protease with chaperone function